MKPLLPAHAFIHGRYLLASYEEKYESLTPPSLNAIEYIAHVGKLMEYLVYHFLVHTEYSLHQMDSF